jgi:D-alanine-D-alanine ligase
MGMNKKKLKLGVIYGGRSEERDVSLHTAEQVIKFLDKKKYSVVPIEIAKDGSWPKTVKLDQLRDRIDLAFIAMHGPFGEDGTIQGFFETLGIPYTFSGVLASSLAMDKSRSQQLLSSLAVKVPQSILLTRHTVLQNSTTALKEVKNLGKIIIVKPNRLGSSVGVHKIENKPALVIKALKDVLKHDDNVLVQEFITGWEITASVLGNDQPKALPLIEIIPKAKDSIFYDYAAKYEDGGSDHIIPAKLPKNLTKQIQNTAILAHLSLGCLGVSRSDFIVTANQEVYYLETNTIPGMTSTSLLPQSAAKAGISFTKLLDMIIRLAE